MANTTKWQYVHSPKLERKKKGRTLLTKLTFNANCRYQFSILKTVLFMMLILTKLNLLKLHLLLNLLFTITLGVLVFFLVLSTIINMKKINRDLSLKKKEFYIIWGFAPSRLFEFSFLSKGLLYYLFFFFTI